MKNWIAKGINWFNSFKDQVADIKKNDRCNTITDLLFFGLTTEESIELFDKIQKAFDAEMDTRRAEALKERRVIDMYFKQT